MIQSPLNYTGGKYKLLPQILPLFPREIDLFVDLFCGGCNVGLNVESRRVLYNDLDRNLLGLYQAFRSREKEVVLEEVYGIIREYGLSLVSRNGYDYYHCDSGKGLGNWNREKFLHLRRDFNRLRAAGTLDFHGWMMLYLLIVYSFNNQIRFNSRGEFNLPVGKRDFNRKMEEKLLAFLDRIQTQDCRFTCQDFRDFDPSVLTGKDLVYLDPPYLITCATYNEKGGWGPEAEADLLSFLDRLDRLGLRFALSNVLRSKGKENALLLDWLERNNARYQAISLQYSYSNSNYHTKDRISAAEEVLIVNYPIPEG